MQTLPMNEETLNALHESHACLLIALTATMPPDLKEDAANRLAQLAAAAEKAGRTTLETMLIDLQAAARK